MTRPPHGEPGGAPDEPPRTDRIDLQPETPAGPAARPNGGWTSTRGDNRVSRTDERDDNDLRTPEERRAEAAAVLDRPIDKTDLSQRIRRPGLARSTRILLLVLGGVVVLALGALIGRATAPDTGPGSLPDVVGVVESVGATTGGFPQITLHTADGNLAVLQTTSGTRVAVPRPDGLAGVRTGQQVTVSGERSTLGTLTATRVDVPPGP